MGVTSNNSLSARRISESQPSIDEFITKDELLTPKERTDLAKRIRSGWRFNRFMKDVAVPGGIPSLYTSKKAKKQIGRIVNEVTHNSGAEVFESVNSVELKSLSGGRSGSAVFELNPKIGQEKADFVNAVLKVSPINHAQLERDNYVRFVRWILPFGWRPELLGYGECGTFGGICYSFISGDNVPLITLTDILQNGKDGTIKYVIDQILGKSNAAWYGASLTKKVESGSLYEIYRNRYFTDSQFNSTVEEFQRFILGLDKGSLQPNAKIKYGEVEIDIATRTLFNKDQNVFLESVQHGDMNSNNILLTDEETPKIKFIDFQDTGYFHVWCDFVTMYVSIVIGWPEISGENPLSVVGQHAEGVPPELRLICSSIRDHAINNFPEEFPKNFDFALAMFALRIMRLELREFQFVRLAAIVLSSMKVLEES